MRPDSSYLSECEVSFRLSWSGSFHNLQKDKRNQPHTFFVYTLITRVAESLIIQMCKRISDKLKSWRNMMVINRRSKLYSLISILLCLISIEIIVSVVALVYIAIVALCSGEYTIDFTLRGIAYFFKFWESYSVLISVLVGSITLCFAGYTLKQALDVATINSLTGLREKFNEQRKKSLHLFLMKDSEYPSDDKSDCNLAERITSDSNAKGVMINTDVSLDFNSADVLDYLGTIETGE